MVDLTLPPEVMDSAIPTGNDEVGWKPESFLGTLQHAVAHGLACLGGQFQWVLPDSTCEAYWLNFVAESHDVNHAFERSACQRRCRVPLSLGSSAPAQRKRYLALVLGCGSTLST